jgi:glycosyltransferase involved in cell wall biosynthesis
MRIAQVAPLSEAVPPKAYGGTERVVSWLTEALVDRGHDVTLFATGDSITSAKLVPGCPTGLRLAGVRDPVASHLVLLDEVHRRQAEFDIIHFHIDLLQFPMFQDIAWKTVTTLHGRLDLPDFHPVYRAFSRMPLVSISDNQRLPMPATANWVSTIYHGLPPKLYEFDSSGGSYLAFLGRISPEKGLDRAIAIAKSTGMRLKIAAKLDALDHQYFQMTIAPLLEDPLIDFIGEIDDAQKSVFLGNAKALLFPIDWCEPFGLVMTEAMACGTPVIAWRNGSVPEVMAHGHSGYVVDSVDEAVGAVGQLDKLSRAGVRAHFDAHFTDARMASQYVAVYEHLLATHKATATIRVVPFVSRTAPPTIRLEPCVAGVLAKQGQGRPPISTGVLAMKIHQNISTG